MKLDFSFDNMHDLSGLQTMNISTGGFRGGGAGGDRPHSKNSYEKKLYFLFLTNINGHMNMIAALVNYYIFVLYTKKMIQLSSFY